MNRNALNRVGALFREGTSQGSLLSRLPKVSFDGPGFGLPNPSEPQSQVLTILAIVFFTIFGLALAIYIYGTVYQQDSPLNGVLGLSTYPKSQTYWTNFSVPANGDPPSSLLVKKEDNVAGRPAIYSVMFDLFIDSSSAPKMGSYRHILHRGSDDYNQAAGESIVQGITGNTSSTDAWSASEASSKSHGGGTPLPVFMNPGVFLHPYRNDLVFFFQTEAAQADVTGYDVLYLESLAIDDVPLKEWLRITVVLNGSVADVYMNGLLQKSIILQGKPRTVPMAWYGRSGPTPAYGVIQNMKVWNGALNPKQVQDSASGGMPAPVKLSQANESCDA
jgi:hypothetical protein